MAPVRNKFSLDAEKRRYLLFMMLPQSCGHIISPHVPHKRAFHVYPSYYKSNTWINYTSGPYAENDIQDENHAVVRQESERWY